MEYREDLEKANAKKKIFKKTLSKVRNFKDKNLDATFHEKHDEAFEEIDCLKCANCCKTTSPIFRDIDISRLSKSLKMNIKDFTQQYLKLDNENDYVLKSSPCPFLNEDNTCQVYPNRPKACREYPHTDRKPIRPILNLTFKNTQICPAVSRIVNAISEER